MMRVVIILAAVVTLLSGGALEYAYGRTKAGPAEVRQIQDSLTAIPLTLRDPDPLKGDWIGKDIEYEAKLLNRAKAQAHIFRNYRNATTEETLELMILAGSPRDMGAHDPTVCFAGVGFRPEKPEVARNVRYGSNDQSRSATYQYTRFEVVRDPSVKLDLFWAWRGAEGWEAPSNPRYWFKSELIIQKMYVAKKARSKSRVGQQADSNENSIEQFLRLLLPSIPTAGNESTKG